MPQKRKITQAVRSSVNRTAKKCLRLIRRAGRTVKSLDAKTRLGSWDPQARG